MRRFILLTHTLREQEIPLTKQRQLILRRALTHLHFTARADCEPFWV